MSSSRQRAALLALPLTAALLLGAATATAEAAPTQAAPAQVAPALAASAEAAPTRVALTQVAPALAVLAPAAPAEAASTQAAPALATLALAAPAEAASTRIAPAPAAPGLAAPAGAAPVQVASARIAPALAAPAGAAPVQVAPARIAPALAAPALAAPAGVALAGAAQAQVVPALVAPAQAVGGEAVPAGSASLTCQGQGVDPAAKVRYRTETFIPAPISTVWRLQTDVERWPSWQQPVTTMKRLDPGPLRPHSQFRWTTPVPATPAGPATTLVITSTVQQLQHDRCIRWTGPAIGDGLHIDGVHVWNFIPMAGGVLVRTEETHTGPQVDANVTLATQYLAEGLESWLTDLKTAAETPHC